MVRLPVPVPSTKRSNRRFDEEVEAIVAAWRSAVGGTSRSARSKEIRRIGGTRWTMPIGGKPSSIGPAAQIGFSVAPDITAGLNASGENAQQQIQDLGAFAASPP